MRIPRTGLIPPGKAGLVVLAAALLPVALKRARPLVKKVGSGLMRVGEMLQRSGDDETRQRATAPNEGMSEERRADSSAAGNPVKHTGDVDAPAPEADSGTEASASPAGREEIRAKKAATAKGDAEVEETPPVKRRRKRTQPAPDQPLNPKRTGPVPPRTPRARKRRET
jgi:hypothetical protein